MSIKQINKLIEAYFEKISLTIQKYFDIRNIEEETIQNNFFRKVLFTGKYMQLVLMSINPLEEIGEERHKNVDQFFRIDQGEGMVIIDGKEEIPIKDGSSIIISAGVKHNIKNTSKTKKLKLYSIYSPPNHPEGAIHKTKNEAMNDEHDH